MEPTRFEFTVYGESTELQYLELINLLVSNIERDFGAEQRDRIMLYAASRFKSDIVYSLLHDLSIFQSK